MKAISFTLTYPRYFLGFTLGRYIPNILWNGLSCTSLKDIDDPKLPGEDWVLISTRYGGICGTDMSVVNLRSSTYYEPFGSFPFTIGHENVGQINKVGSQVDSWTIGDRVVAEPLLWCEPRGFTHYCRYCAAGEINRCERYTQGNLHPGLVIGACRDTGGSWSGVFSAHKSQLYRIPEDVSDENALMVEPFAVGLHAALLSTPSDDETVLIIGAGTIGLCQLAALRALGSKATIFVLARYEFQAEAARKLGASRVIMADRMGDYYTELGELTGAEVHKPFIGKRIVIGGVDRTFECVGSDHAVDDAIRLTRAGGEVVVVGLPGMAKGVDWTAIFLHELTVKGSYVYHHNEVHAGEKWRTFDLAIDIMARGVADLSWLITHRFELEQYSQAFMMQRHKGRHELIKGVFEF